MIYVIINTEELIRHKFSDMVLISNLD